MDTNLKNDDLMNTGTPAPTGRPESVPAGQAGLAPGTLPEGQSEAAQAGPAAAAQSAQEEAAQSSLAMPGGAARQNQPAAQGRLADAPDAAAQKAGPANQKAGRPTKGLVQRRPGRMLRRMLYRWLAWMLLLAFFCCVCSSLEMAMAFVKDPQGVLEGQVTAVPAYRSEVARLSALAMQAAAHPPAESEPDELLKLLQSTDSLLCYIARPTGVSEEAWPEVFCAPLQIDEAGCSLLFSWQASQQNPAEATFLGQAVPLSQLEMESGAAFPSLGELEGAVVMLAGREALDSPLYQHTFTARRWQFAAWLCCGVLALALLLFLYTAIFARDVRAGKALVARALGRVWLEAKLAAAAGVLLYLFRSRLVYTMPIDVLLPGPRLLAGLFFFYLLWADLGVNGPAFFARSFCAAAVRGAVGFCRRQPWQRRVLGGFCAGMLAAAGLAAASAWAASHARFSGMAQLLSIACALGALAALAGCCRILARLVDEGSLLAGKLADLRAGRPSRPLALPEASLLAGPAEDLNRVEEGIARAVEERSRADRMKVELVTNVSHDIKTPLTSIVSYADLLCAEPNLPAPAAEYARILQQKAAQLRGMVQDVFELSKAASGNLPLSLAPLDLAKLIWQTLADMDEKISASPAEFKVHLAPEAWVTADGDKLYRVFQNLFANAAQYSLPGSRVYVTLTAEGGRALASVKNVANYEMGFDPAEITERFVRGDAARTTEGSGLGLSIARSFTEACGGSLEVRVDADLFCVSVALPLTNRPAPAGGPDESAPETTAPANTGMPDPATAAETASCASAAFGAQTRIPPNTADAAPAPAAKAALEGMTEIPLSGPAGPPAP